MPTSSTVSAGNDILASEYNNLRTDVLTTHVHNGTEGTKLYAVGNNTWAGGTATQAITGVGFQPSLIEIHATVDSGGSGTNPGISLGRYDGTNTNTIYMYFNGLASANSAADTTNIVNIQSGGAGYTATISAVGGDGFTLSWTQVGGGRTIDYTYICWR